MFYVYVIKSIADGDLYIGYTNNLKRRLSEHNDLKNSSTKHRGPFKLVYYEAYLSRGDARYRESQLKRFGGAMTHLRKRIKNSVIGT